MKDVLHRVSRWTSTPGTGFALAVVSALLLWAAFPPWRLSPLVLFALAPLWLAAASAPSLRRAAALGLVAGTVFGLLSVHWLRVAHPTGYLGWLALALYLGTYWAGSAALAWTYRQAGAWTWCIVVSAGWVGLEYLRGWLLGGFPWFYLPHVFYRHPGWFQSVAVVGVYGLSAIVALANAAAVIAVRSHNGWSRFGPAAVAVLLVIANWLYGWTQLRTAPQHGSGPRVALVQTNVPQTVKADPREADELEMRFLALNRRIEPGTVDLVVWPETTWRHVWVDVANDVPDAQVGQLLQVSRTQLDVYLQRVRERINTLAADARAPTLLGLNIQVLDSEGLRTYNSAVLIRPDGEWERPYHKLVLLPFGEYVPLERWLPWLRWLSPNTQGSGSLSPGQTLGVYRVGGWKIGILICFEDTLPWLSRRYVAEHDVDVLVNLTNDGWFGRTVQHEIHLATSVFRAAECGRPMSRAVNTGISAVIDAYGRLVAVAGGGVENGVWRELILEASVPVVRRDTLYVRWVGDFPGLGLLILTLFCSGWRLCDAFCISRFRHAGK